MYVLRNIIEFNKQKIKDKSGPWSQTDPLGPKDQFGTTFVFCSLGTPHTPDS